MPILHLQMCRSSNPLMETMKENHKAYTVHMPILHLQMCRSNNPLMETMKKNNKVYTATCHSPFAEV